MPLGDGSPGVGQHVGPVAQLRPRAVEAHKDLADGIVLADLVIVQNSYNNLHFLWKEEKESEALAIWEIKLTVSSTYISMVVADFEQREAHAAGGPHAIAVFRIFSCLFVSLKGETTA